VYIVHSQPKKKFASLEAASAHASSYFEKSGVIVGVEKIESKELQALKAARAAALAKSRAIWERDGKQDRGSCGGAILKLDARSKLAKVAVAEGFASKESGSDIYVNSNIAEGVHSQNADIWQDSMRAFRDVIEAAGYAKAIKKFWTYID
jgi:hypothetical protein